MQRVSITQEMRQRAAAESDRRNAHIRHHFEVSHLTGQERDQLGFVGEFACSTFLGMEWKDNIREDYLTVDDYDFIFNGHRIDVKTETVPYTYAMSILQGKIKDDGLYGRRLIHQGQFNLLYKYDKVIFGLCIRNQMDYWYPIGYMDTADIINDFPPTSQRPDGGKYPFPGSPVPTSMLKPLDELFSKE